MTGTLKLNKSIAAFMRDTNGIILPYVTVMLVVIVGVAVLALDGARYMSLQSQLQNGADALALAGAAELDLLPDSEVRAMNAINKLLANTTSVGMRGKEEIRAASVLFYSQLPENDSKTLSPDFLATDPTSARFVSVVVQPVTMATVLPAAFFGGADHVTTGASAVAGMNKIVCKVPPIFVCNPFETRDMSYDQATNALQYSASDPRAQRRLIRMRQNGGATVQYSPGDYGFLLNDYLGSDDSSLIAGVAQANPGACFQQRGVTIRGGLVGAINEGFNVRFDLYSATMMSKVNDANYRPAANVRKGYVGGGAGGASCSASPANNWPIGSPPNQTTGFPLDRQWSDLIGRMGNGEWDFETYWQVNHGGSGREPPMINGSSVSNSNLSSRYDIYRYEIDQGITADVSFGGESGAPVCYRGDTLSRDPDRRIIYAAVINCLSLNLGIGDHTDVPVAGFGKFFITIPMPNSQSDLFLETVGLISRGDPPSNYEIVQLYR